MSTKRQARVKVAIEEAKRFLDRAEAYLNRDNDDGWVMGTKEGGALRRSSMDLTRALADLRRPN
jgi:hypothetical protein